MFDPNYTEEAGVISIIQDPNLTEIAIRDTVSIEVARQVGMHFLKYGGVPKGSNWRADMSDYEV